jgi:hypothetical protein
MTTSKSGMKIALTALLLAMFSVTWGCSQQKPQSARDDAKQVNPISESAPKFEPMPRTAPVIKQATLVASVGECAPKYANGLHGSCVNNQACRGIGVLDEKGAVVCSCFGRAACGEKERCDAVKKACVPENEPGFGHGEDD